MDEVSLRIIGQFFNYGLIGIVAVVLGYLYWRSQLKIDALNALILEMTKATTTALTNNTAALHNAAAANDRSTESFRELTESVRDLANRRGR